MSRTYGFETDNRTVRPDEAKVLREVAERWLDGEPMRSILLELNDRGVRTSRGGPWSASTMKRLLINPVMVPKILPRRLQQRIIRKYEKTSRPRTVTPRQYLLTGGLARCGLCGAVLLSAPANSGRRGYACRTTPRHRGCGRIRVQAEGLEQYVVERVLARLASPFVRRRLETVLRDLTDEHTDVQRRLEQLGIDYADGLISRQAFLAAQERLTSRLAELRSAERRLGRLEAIPVEVTPESLAEWWDQASPDEQHALISAVVDRVEVGPALQRGRTEFEPERVTISWR